MKKLKIEILNKKEEGRARINIYGEIGYFDWWEETGVTDTMILEQLEEAGGKPLDVHINSVGGNIFDGVAIYNALKEYPGEVVVHVDALAASIASIVMLAGDRRKMGTGAQVMIHDPWTAFLAMGSAEEIEKQSEQVGAALKSAKEAMLEIYTTRTGLDREEVAEMMEAETWMTADEAVAKGFATEKTGGANNIAARLNSLAASLKPSPAASPRGKIISSIIDGAIGYNTKSEEQQSPAQKAGTFNNTDEKNRGEKMTVEDYKQQQAEREAKIRALFDGMPEHENLMLKCIIEGNTFEEATARLIDAMKKGKKNEPAEPLNAPRVQVLQDNAEEGIAKALQARAEKRRDPENEFANITPLGLLGHVADKHGVAINMRLDNSSLVNNLLNKSQVMDDFSVKMGSFVHRAAQFAYSEQATTYERFTRERSLNDFRPHEIHARGQLGLLQVKNSDGDYQQILLPDDEKQSYSALERGGIVSIDRKVLINDDWGTIEDQATDAGAVAARTVEHLVYNMLLQNPTLADGKPLFDESRGNILGTDEMDEKTWLKLYEHFEGLTAPGSPNAFLNITPKHILTDARGGFAARALNAFETGKEGKKTAGLFDNSNIITSPYMRGKPEIYLGDAPIVEVGWVGTPGPSMALEEKFESGAFRARILVDVGVGVAGWRGAAIRKLPTAGESRAITPPAPVAPAPAPVAPAAAPAPVEAPAKEAEKGKK